MRSEKYGLKELVLTGLLESFNSSLGRNPAEPHPSQTVIITGEVEITEFHFKTVAAVDC